MQHSLDVSEADIDYVVGNSSLLSTPLRPGYKVWGIAGNDANATYSNWGHLLRAAALQTLSQRLDIVQTVGKLSAHLGTSQHIDVKMMGPSGHAAYLVNVLKAGLGMWTRHVSVDDDLAAQPSSEGVREGAIAIVGMSGKGPGSEDLDEFWNIIETGKDCHQEIPTDRFSLDEYYCAKHGAARRHDALLQLGELRVERQPLVVAAAAAAHRRQQLRDARVASAFALAVQRPTPPHVGGVAIVVGAEEGPQDPGFGVGVLGSRR